MLIFECGAISTTNTTLKACVIIHNVVVGIPQEAYIYNGIGGSIVDSYERNDIDTDSLGTNLV